ncbi:MAG TPA: enolase C-terminal domain-like protein [Candidatus Binatia bacterium]|nr:enolase C-terminal domain-like protein [Candidatus Binatia bacterium]
MADVIARVETFALNLPYRSKVQFRSSQGSSGAYALLRLTTRDGAEGIAEVTGIANIPESDPKILENQIDRFFRPLLEGADPLDHNRQLVAIDKIRGAPIAKALIDVALWDLKGKLLGQPVWRLLGGGPVKTIPVTAVLFGDTAAAMLGEAERAVQRGIRSLKVKLWRHCIDDIILIRDIRKAVGDDVFIYADANYAYTETEARSLLPKLADYNVSMIEDPCRITAERLALLSRALPIAILGEIPIDSLAAAYNYIKLDAIGAVSVHLRRTGLTESLKIVALSEAACLPALIGTDLESGIGALSRVHLRAAIPSLDPLPSEIQFFEHLADDVLAESLSIVDGAIEVPDRPGFGGSIDQGKLKQYRV